MTKVAEFDPSAAAAYEFFADPSALRSSVGIVMRTKDRPVLLHRALSSVALQKFHGWHLYLVNDGGDAALVDQLVHRYRKILRDRITVIHQAASQGKEAASNAALERMTGEDFVVVHDDDDTWHPDFLDEAVAFLEDPAHETFVAVSTGCLLVRERIASGRVREVSREPWLYGRGVGDCNELFLNNPWPSICLLIRRGALGAIGGFNANLPVLGDWDANLKLIRFGDFAYLDKPLAYYHQRMPGTNSAYSNTVVDGVSQHERQKVLFVNNIVREALNDNPRLLGLLLPMLRAQRETRDRLENAIHSVNIRPEVERLEHAIRSSVGGAPAYSWLLALLELEVGKLLSSVGLKKSGSVAWNHAIASLRGDTKIFCPSLVQWISARLKLKAAELYCTLGQKEIGGIMWNEAKRALGD